MQVRALKTFSGRQGLVRAGQVVTVDERYAKQLLAGKLVEPHRPDYPLKPESDKNLGDAPEKKDGDEGNESRGESNDSTSSQGQESSATEDSSAAQPAGGRRRPLSSQQVGRRSRKKT